MGVVQMKQSMTSQEFHGWMIYLSNKQPDAHEIQLAVLTSMVGNAMGSKRPPTDFIIHKERKSNKEASTDVMGQTSVMAAFAGIAVPMD